MRARYRGSEDAHQQADRPNPARFHPRASFMIANDLQIAISQIQIKSARGGLRPETPIIANLLRLYKKENFRLSHRFGIGSPASAVSPFNLALSSLTSFVLLMSAWRRISACCRRRASPLSRPLRSGRATPGGRR